MAERNEFEAAKYAMLLDMLRRATANGTHEKVASTILADWFPMCTVDAHGRVGVKLSDGEQGQEKKS